MSLIGYTLVFTDDINELFYEFEQVKDTPAYLHNEHPARKILKKLYTLIEVKVAEDNEALLEARKRREQREKLDAEVRAKVEKAQQKFFDELVKIELAYFENEDVLCHLSAQQVLRPFDLAKDSNWHENIRSKVLDAKS